MKRFIICVAAAIVALVSCSKTQVVNNDVPEEIGFKAVTGVVTKAEQTGTNLQYNLGAFSYVHGASPAKVYFGNTQFAKGTEGLWVATPAKYWPLVSTLDFVVYSPYDPNAAYNETEAPNTLVVTTNNANKFEITDQMDYLYGDKYYDNSGAGYGKTTENVPVSLKHAQAKVIVTFTGTSDVTINSASVTNVSLGGKYSVNYTQQTPVAQWSDQQAGVEIPVLGSAGLDASKTYTFLAVPSTASTIKFNYTLGSDTADMDHEIDLSPWAPGTQYTYTINITPQEIKFKPEVIVWETESQVYPL